MSNVRSITELTAEVVKTFLDNNQIEVDQVGHLIRSVHKALKDTTSEQSYSKSQPVKLVDHTKQPQAEIIPPPSRNGLALNGQRPFLPIEQSITPDYIYCLEDGKKFKTMRHHIAKRYGLSPEEYRRKWNLPADYPMTAPNHSQARRNIAKSFGLGSRIR